MINSEATELTVCPPYTTSKHGVTASSKCAAIDYAQEGIRVNAVRPGFAHSELVDPYVDNAPEMMKAIISRHCGMKRLGEADEMAAPLRSACALKAGRQRKAS